MSTANKLLFLSLLSALIFSCSESNYKFKLSTTEKTKLGKKATIKLEQLKGENIDSVLLYINEKRVNKNEKVVTVNTTTLGVGKHLVTALVFYPNHTKKITNSIEVFPNQKPKIYTYKIINTYPHDKNAYTQGLEFHNGFLYETTGRRGKSSLRKVEIATGKVLQKIDLDDQYFGEGMTIFDNKIFWLTWQAQKGFIYDLETFQKINEFSYDKSIEGWGLSHTGTDLIKSDGSNKIWFLNPDTLVEKKYIQVYLNTQALDKLNEIEYVNGKIYSNYWKTDGKITSTIAIIDIESGIIEGLIGLDGLRDIILKDQKLDQDEVLNGIAYNAENNHFYVTGKHWGKLFEIEVVAQ